MTAPVSLFLATPSHDGSLWREYVGGVVQLNSHFHRTPHWEGFRHETICGSWLPRLRDALTKQFLDSGFSHMLCVDSDVAFTPADVEALLATNKWVVSGCYPRKQDDRRIPAELLDASGTVRRARYVPGGFLLLSRAAVVAMFDRYTDGLYDGGQALGMLPPLWQPFPPGGEDAAFCKRWRDMGGEVWIHLGVRLRHHGAQTWEPEGPLRFDGLIQEKHEGLTPTQAVLREALSGEAKEDAGAHAVA